MMHSNPVTEITYSRKYAPLFNLTTRYCIVMGGRGSAKSHAESTNEVCNTFNPDQLTLFTRYTMTSAEISIIPEFWEKVELMNYAPIFYKTKASVVNKQTGSGILFRGIRTSCTPLKLNGTPLSIKNLRIIKCSSSGAFKITIT